MFKKILIALALVIPFLTYGQDLSIKAVNPLPAKVIENTTVSGLKYTLTNNSGDTLSIVIKDLNQKGMAYSTNCGSLAASASCDINLTLTVPPVPAGKDTLPYNVTGKILGAPQTLLFPLNSTVIKTGSAVTPTINISLNQPGITTTENNFDVNFYGDTNYECENTEFGSHAFCEAIPQGNYNVAVSPSSVTGSDDNTYDAPAQYPVHVTSDGQVVPLVYTENTDIAVDTDLTAPELGLATVACTATGTGGTYGPNNQASGTQAFDTMKPGSYTMSCANYVGDDEQTYIPSYSNPYTIDGGHTTISVTYAAQPPSTEHVFTNITAPSLPSGQTVAITLENGDHTYGPHNQAAGNTSFDTVADASDYTLTCANYTVGPDTYGCTLSNPYIVDSGHTVLNITYSKLAPPGANFDWHASHLDTLKNANIFAVWWGGGSTTGPIKISSNPDPNQFLIDSIATYEGATTPVASTAHVQNFPDYIAQGTISEFTPTVTDALKAQHLDIDNHYEGNGDGNAGCAFDNADGYQTQMTVGGSNTTTVTDALTYNVFTDYYQYSTVAYTTTLTAPNLPGGQKLNIKMVNTHGDTYVQDQTTGSQIAFDNVLPGTYTVTAASYVGTDEQNYVATVSNPYTVDGNHKDLVLTYSVNPSTIAPSTVTTPQKSQTFYYDGTVNITNTSGNNYLATVTFTQVPLHPNPNLSLVKQQALPANAVVSYNLTAPKLYYTITNSVNLNIQSDGLCKSIWYSWGGYTPQIDNIAAQAKEVTTDNSHNLIAGSVMYTTRNSDSFDNMTDDVTNDFSLVFFMYNLLYEGYRMEYQYNTNAVDMVLLLNPDSTNPFQNCTQYYCPFIWKTGLTQDTTNQLIQIPNMQADAGKALDRMVAKGYLSAPSAASIKALIQSSGILVPPAGSGRTVPGVPELYLLYNLLVKQVAPNVPFGYGQNSYDNANPLMAVGTPPVAGAPWETASVTWLHKVNHLGYSSEIKSAAIQFEAAKYAQFLKDMNYVSYSGDAFAAYKPDFIYYDRYERDAVPSAVSAGFLFNGVDWDTYIQYIGDISTLTNNVTPVAMWQMPGASLQVQGTTLPNNLSDTMPDYVFGHPAINNDMSNLDTSLNYSGISFAGYLNTSVYYTTNSGVSNAEDYIKLTSASASRNRWLRLVKPIAYGQINCKSNLDCYRKLSKFYKTEAK